MCSMSRDCGEMARSVRLDVALIAIPDERGGLVGIMAIMREADRNITA